jgi:peptidoglycan/xylan/chitin deacetylase (PgdA/CDA1 family)
MIGVIAHRADHEVIREFFELFKTPWEFYQDGRAYDVLLSTGGGRVDTRAKLVLVYSSQNTGIDCERNVAIGRQRRDSCILKFQDQQLPVYGESLTFRDEALTFLTDATSRECVGCLHTSEEQVVARIGYDLFVEVRILLSVGQPASNAFIPTLDLQIALLRNLITASGIELAEIPPAPDGFRFIACLTHDVDHPLIRQHKWDYTVLGFLYRAVFGSVWRCIREQMPVRDLLVNWAAVLKLPLVYLGLAKDFWSEFDDRYLGLESGVRSTFFVIPFKDRPGLGPTGPAPALRATRYEARDIADSIGKLVATGNEVGLHGIDAWVDSSKGRKELDEIRSLTMACETGVRMHWLYFSAQSPAMLESAGASYDSTVGYNETVGYRSGTTQAYKPLEANQLLELPMHIMDTALFYLSYLGLTPEKAKILLSQMADRVDQWGGVLTVNWHDRSVAPERLWGEFYRELVQDLRRRGAWLATAGQTVSWFRRRRSAIFETDAGGRSCLYVKAEANPDGRLPGLRLRRYKAVSLESLKRCRALDYADVAVNETPK